MQRRNRRDRQRGELAQDALHLRAVFSDDAEVVSAGLVLPGLRTVERAEFAEGVRRKDDPFLLVIGHHDLRPMHHRRGNEAERAAAQRQRIPVLDGQAAPVAAIPVEALHHGERLGGRHDGRLGIALQEQADIGGVIRLHVLHDEIVGLAAAQHAGDVFQPCAAKARLHRIQNGDFLIRDDIGIIGHAVRHGVLRFKQVEVVIVHAHINDFRTDGHGYLPPHDWFSPDFANILSAMRGKFNAFAQIRHDRTKRG